MKGQENKPRQRGEKLNQQQQEPAVVAVHQHPAQSAKDQARRRAAQPQHSQCHGRTGDFIGDPIERDFLDEMSNGTQQIAGPEERIVAVTKGSENAYGTCLLFGRLNGNLSFIAFPTSLEKIRVIK
jgi:hypothetical protein